MRHAGENEVVREALGVPPIQARGVRVLALDGGGMKGIALVQMLRAMQARLPQPLHTYWDLVVSVHTPLLPIAPFLHNAAPLPLALQVRSSQGSQAVVSKHREPGRSRPWRPRPRSQVGTSTGAIVAVSMAVLRMPCDAVEAIYTELGQKVRPPRPLVLTARSRCVPACLWAAAHRHPLFVWAPCATGATTQVFNAARVPGTAEESQTLSWRDSLYRVYRSTGQHMRVAVYGSKHDPTAFETLLREFADLKNQVRSCR